MGYSPWGRTELDMTERLTLSLSSAFSTSVFQTPDYPETRVESLSREDPSQKGMATHSNILAWRIPWTKEPGWLQSMGSQESDTT